MDDEHAFAFLPFGITEDNTEVRRGRAMNGLILPMLMEDGEWKIDLPGWRFMDNPKADDPGIRAEGIGPQRDRAQDEE